MDHRDYAGRPVREASPDDAYTQLRYRKRALRHADGATLRDLYAEYVAHEDGPPSSRAA